MPQAPGVAAFSGESFRRLVIVRSLIGFGPGNLWKANFTIKSPLYKLPGQVRRVCVFPGLSGPGCRRLETPRV